MTTDRPYKHLRMWAHEHCTEWREGDKVFIIGKTYQQNEVGEHFTPCPQCWPKPTSDQLLHALTAHGEVRISRDGEEVTARLMVGEVQVDEAKEPTIEEALLDLLAKWNTE